VGSAAGCSVWSDVVEDAGLECNPPGVWSTSVPERIAKSRNGTERIVNRATASEMPKKVGIPRASTEHTTVVLRKLPEEFTRMTVMGLLEGAGLNKLYNFLYVPTNFRKCVRFGYAIVNFVSHEAASDGIARLSTEQVKGKLISVEWSDSIQGLDSLLCKYRNSAVMHETVDPVHQPVVLHDGRILPFPQPTEALAMPPCVMQRTVPRKCSTSGKSDKVQMTTAPNLTTLVLRKLPKDMTRDVMQKILDTHGFARCYDFLYVPMDFAKARCFGFAIVNFIDAPVALAALAHFSKAEVCRQKLTAEWSASHHGLSSLVEKYTNSKVMRENIPEIYKPLVLSRGVPVPFPNVVGKC